MTTGKVDASAVGLPTGAEALSAEAGAPSVRRAMASAARHPSVVAAALWLLLVGVASIFSSQLAPYDPLAQNVIDSYALPSAHHLLGTDQLGRDILSRLIFGGRGILLGCCETVAIALAIGVPCGLLAGYRGGWVDSALAFVVNVLFSIPGFVVLIAIAFITGDSLPAIMGALGVLASATILRLVRSSAQSVRSEGFVDYARMAGVPLPLLLTRHILRNTLGTLVVQVFFLFSLAFVISASLSFLSLGFNPATPSWGQMVFDATQNIYLHSWLMVPVGVVLTATVLAFQTIGNAVREALPHAKRTSLLADKRGPLTVVEPWEPRSGLIRAPEPETAVSSPMPGTGADVLLRVEGLCVSFPGRDASRYNVVDGVDLSIRRGEMLGVVGESGSGKTMTALALLDLVPRPGLVSARTFEVAGRNVLALQPKERARLRGRVVSYVSQEPMVALDPCFTIGSTLSEPLRLIRGLGRKAARTEALELLRRVGIARPDVVARSYPHQLSGGMAQRVAIALALVAQPELLIADEPTTALDVTIQAEILDLLRELQSETGMTVVLVTHDLGVVADVCSRVAVMYAGQIVEYGETVDVLTKPSHPYTSSLMAAVPSPGAQGRRLQTIGGTVPSPQAWPVGCRFANRCPVAIDECSAAPVPLQVDDQRARRCIREPSVARAATDAVPVSRSDN